MGCFIYPFIFFAAAAMQHHGDRRPIPVLEPDNSKNHYFSQDLDDIRVLRPVTKTVINWVSYTTTITRLSAPVFTPTTVTEEASIAATAPFVVTKTLDVPPAAVIIIPDDTTTQTETLFYPTPISHGPVFTVTPTAFPANSSILPSLLPDIPAFIDNGVACAPRHTVNETYLGPVIVPDDPFVFQSSPTIHTLSLSAETPEGYKMTFHNKFASINHGSYIGMVPMPSYNTSFCAYQCTLRKSKRDGGCHGFNTYVERQPKVNVAEECPNPESMSVFVCALYSESKAVHEKYATNVGYIQEEFRVVIAGSNGYRRTR